MRIRKEKYANVAVVDSQLQKSSIEQKNRSKKKFGKQR